MKIINWKELVYQQVDKTIPWNVERFPYFYFLRIRTMVVHAMVVDQLLEDLGKP